MVQARNRPAALFLFLTVFCKGLRFAGRQLALVFLLQPARDGFAKPGLGFPAVLKFLSGNMRVQGHGCIHTSYVGDFVGRAVKTAIRICSTESNSERLDFPAERILSACPAF